MSDPSSNFSAAFADLVSAVSAAETLVVVSHGNPDGDAIGSAGALVAAARRAGKTAVGVFPGGAPERLAWMAPAELFAEESQLSALLDSADCVIVVDTSSAVQLGDLASAITACSDKLFVLDHHTRPDLPAACLAVDTTAGAAGLLVLELCETLGWPVDLPLAEMLAVAILTDTGWLRFSNTDARILAAMARLVATGITLDTIYQEIYQQERPQRLALKQRSLDSLVWHGGGAIAVMTLRESDFAETGATSDETEGLVNEPFVVGAAEVSILLVEAPGLTRVSLRSRGAVDVADLARKFGGGGHVRAAGIKTPEPLDAFCTTLLAAIEKKGL
ncbi:MAG: bifunctional oligoribonuclease/PAP phosphatase NrnA [Phycisphaerales bacterium]|nr:bifunctional oligoribonuclease/PAP phosphatase NrnA [Phycisphaerales bacterium]